MTLILDLTPEQEETLRQRAAQQGQSAEHYALRLLDEYLASLPPVPDTRPFYETATREERLAALKEWADSLDPNTPVLLDDRREIIYED